MTVEPEIPQYYAGKKILVTGGTGYMGKMLIWKLLTSCPLLDTIYMLIRSKRGKTPMSRRQEVFSNVMFKELKKNSPELLDKVVFISGDVGEEGVGLAQQDHDLITDEISVVFHSAAVLKMDADLKLAININTEGTLRMLKLAEKMTKLEAFVYISTAYCCCENDLVEEKIYPSKHNPYDIIHLTHWMSPELLNMITPRLINPLPNTYTYSKRLTELIFDDYKSRIPVIIARPTIVIPSFKEPVPGWVDNMNGPVGVYVAVGKGVLRSIFANKETKANFVPVDVAVNGIITLPWAHRQDNLLGKITVYNVGETEHKPTSWARNSQLGKNSLYKYPIKKILWYPNFNVYETNIIRHKIKVFFLHWIRAYIIDFILVLIGQKPFMVHVTTKIENGMKVLSYFMQREWRFVNDNLLRIKDTMNEADRELFPVTMKAVTDDQLYMDNSVFFAKTYILKEDPSTIEFSKKLLKGMYLLDKFVIFITYIFVAKILMMFYNIFIHVIEVNQHQQQIYDY